MITEAEFNALMSEYGGVCLQCGYCQYGGVEPDAEEYECEECGAHAVMGAELAVVSGAVELDEGGA